MDMYCPVPLPCATTVWPLQLLLLDTSTVYTEGNVVAVSDHRLTPQMGSEAPIFTRNVKFELPCSTFGADVHAAPPLFTPLVEFAGYAETIDDGYVADGYMPNTNDGYVNGDDETALEPSPNSLFVSSPNAKTLA